MIYYLSQLIAVFIGTIGFSIVFRQKNNRLLFSGIGGTLTFFIYLICTLASLNDFSAYLIATMVGTAYAESMARIIKAPATILLIPCIIPLVPGGLLYYATSNAVNNNTSAFQSYALLTAEAVLGIAGGIIIVSVCFRYFIQLRRMIQKKLHF